MQNVKQYFLLVHLHPLFFLTLSFIVGIWWQSSSISYIFPISFCLILFISAYVLKKNFLYIALLILTFTGGAYNYYHQITKYEHIFNSIEGISGNLIASITSYDQVPQFFNHRYTLKLQELSSLNETIKPVGHIYVYTKHKAPIRIGDIIKFFNISFQKIKNEGFKKYLIKEGIIGTTFCHTLTWKLISRPTFCLQRWLFEQRKLLFQRFKQKMNSKTFIFFSSLFLGYRQFAYNTMQKLKRHFKYWGLSHYLARSGLHLVIFILAWQIILGIIPFGWYLKQVLLILLTLIYFLLTFASISFIRAFFIFLLYKLGALLRYEINIVHAITLITLFVLILNPIQLFFLDFQLSFLLTFALAWLHHLRKLSTFSHL